jgi:hypothetical protein
MVCSTQKWFEERINKFIDELESTVKSTLSLTLPNGKSVILALTSIQYLNSKKLR